MSLTGFLMMSELDPPPATMDLRVLVLDDEPLIREALSTMLQCLGCRAEAVSTGEEAVARYGEARFDLVCIDLNNPFGMGGLTTMGKLLEIDADVVALVSSGDSNDPVIKNYRSHGFSGCLPKPSSFPQLRDSLRHVLNVP